MRLKALRNAYGISLSETAYLLRVNAKSTVFEWENQKKVPSVENLHMISTVFGTPTTAHFKPRFSTSHAIS